MQIEAEAEVDVRTAVAGRCAAHRAVTILSPRQLWQDGRWQARQRLADDCGRGLRPVWWQRCFEEVIWRHGEPPELSNTLPPHVALHVFGLCQARRQGGSLTALHLLASLAAEGAPGMRHVPDCSPCPGASLQPACRARRRGAPPGGPPGRYPSGPPPMSRGRSPGRYSPQRYSPGRYSPRATSGSPARSRSGSPAHKRRRSRCAVPGPWVPNVCMVFRWGRQACARKDSGQPSKAARGVQLACERASWQLSSSASRGSSQTRARWQAVAWSMPALSPAVVRHCAAACTRHAVARCTPHVDLCWHVSGPQHQASRVAAAGRRPARPAGARAAAGAPRPAGVARPAAATHRSRARRRPTCPPPATPAAARSPVRVRRRAMRRGNTTVLTHCSTQGPCLRQLSAGIHGDACRRVAHSCCKQAPQMLCCLQSVV